MTRAAPVPYSEDIALEICERLVEGESLNSICKSEGMPRVGTVFRWIEANDEFRERYTRAREMQIELQIDIINDIADDARNDYMEKADDDGAVGYKLNGEHIQRSKLRIDTRKWIASKLKPKKYGDKITQEVQGPDGGPVQIAEIRHTIIKPPQ